MLTVLHIVIITKIIQTLKAVKQLQYFESVLLS